MPRTKLDRPVCSVWEGYRGLLLSRMAEYKLSNADLAKQIGVSFPTMTKYLADPGTMTMDTMRKLNRSLDLTADAVRPLLPVR